MSGSHDKLPKLFWVQIILVIIVGTLYLLAPEAEKSHGADAAEVNPTVVKAAKTLEPVGTVAVKTADTGGASGTGQSAEEIYKGICQTCHLAGIANAPKLDDKAAWEPRVAQGLDNLVKTAITGKGAMPPKGGNMKLSDAEIKDTVIYMAKQAGFDLADGTSEKQEKASDTTQAAAPVAVEPKAIDTTPAAPVIAVATDPAKAPEAPALMDSTPPAPIAPTPPVDPVITTAAPEPTATATETQNEPEATVTETEAPKTPGPEVAQKETPKAPEAGALAQTKEAPAADLAKGEKVYKTSCFACHESGVAGSPKLGDVAAWAPRIATGKDSLYKASINGKGVMPPKGGNLGLPDEDVKAAVDYMTAKSQ